MKIISAIYLRCKTTLNDDWMYKPNLEEDLMNGKVNKISIYFYLFLIFYIKIHHTK